MIQTKKHRQRPKVPNDRLYKSENSLIRHSVELGESVRLGGCQITE